MIVRFVLRAANVLLVGCLLVVVEAASAAAQRTFVASTGNDSDPCSIAQPCRSFASAIAQTLTGGEILVLDTAGYGAVTITKSVSIIAPPGVYAGISVTSAGVNGVHINTAGVIVSLRGLSINAVGGAGQHGIFMQAGAELHVRDVEISGMGGNGIHVSAPSSKVFASNVVVRNNAGNGIAIGAGALAVVDGARAEANGSSGVLVNGGASVSLRNAIAVDNSGPGVDVHADAGETTVATIEASHAIANGLRGVSVVADNGGVSSVDVVRSVLARHVHDGVYVFAQPASIAKANVVSSAASYNSAGIAGSGDGAVIIAADCLLNENQSYGLVARSGAAAVYTRGNNTMLGNGVAAISGTTPLGGL